MKVDKDERDRDRESERVREIERCRARDGLKKKITEKEKVNFSLAEDKCVKSLNLTSRAEVNTDLSTTNPSPSPPPPSRKLLRKPFENLERLLK